MDSSFAQSLQPRRLVLRGVIAPKSVQADEHDVRLIALFGSIVPVRAAAHLSGKGRG